jgi:hypothetical protein
MNRCVSCAHLKLSWALILIAALTYNAAPSSAQVYHDATLTGSGTQTSLLGVNVPLSLTYNCNTPICYTTPALSITENTANATAVSGKATGSGTGVYGSGYFGVYGDGTSNGFGVVGAGYQYGIYGTGDVGVYGASTNGYIGVMGCSTSGNGMYAEATSGTALYATTSASGGYGIWSQVAGPNSTALTARNSGSSGGYGAVISSTCTTKPNGYVCNGPALWVNGDSYFNGSVNLMGYVTKPAGSFKIDHPLDPTNKYLYHSFVESPDMMNIYNGNIHTDSSGNATVTLPDWFEPLNRDFRYQLTVIGQFAQAMVSSEIANNSFTIKTDKPNVKVSWQVTGIRQDAWANVHRIPVEVEKPEKERGSYLYPDVHGQAAEKGVLWALFPDKMRELSERAPGSVKR